MAATLDQLQARLDALEPRLQAIENVGSTDVALGLLTELGASLRARSEPEHLYTAAALGGFGAVAWGVATLQPDKFYGREVCLRPAGVAAIGTFLLAVAIVAKICRESGKFSTTKEALKKVVEALEDMLPPAAKAIVPEGMKAAAGNGYLWSIGVVVVGAAGAIAFCLSVVGPFDW